MNYRKERLKKIPIVFYGSKNNDSTIDKSPIADLAELNINHLYNSAEHEEHVYKATQSTLVIKTGMTQQQWNTLYRKGVKTGVDEVLTLGETGEAFILQAQATDLAAESMKHKEMQAIMVGARIILPQGQLNESATAAVIKASGQASILSRSMKNVERAVKDAIIILSQFMSDTQLTESEFTIEMNENYFDRSLDAQAAAMIINAYNNGIVAVNDVRDYFRSTSLLAEDRTNDDIENEIDLSSPISISSSFNSQDLNNGNNETVPTDS